MSNNKDIRPGPCRRRLHNNSSADASLSPGILHLPVPPYGIFQSTFATVSGSAIGADLTHDCLLASDKEVTNQEFDTKKKGKRMRTPKVVANVLFDPTVPMARIYLGSPISGVPQGIAARYRLALVAFLTNLWKVDRVTLQDCSRHLLCIVVKVINLALLYLRLVGVDIFVIGVCM